MSPDLYLTLTLTVVGLAIVFAVLATIAGIVWVLGRVDQHWQERESAAVEAAYEKPQTIDDTTLVLICATVATMVTGRSRIRSVKRLLPLDLPASSWSAQGRAVLMGSHRPRGRDS